MDSNFSKVLPRGRFIAHFLGISRKPLFLEQLWEPEVRTPKHKNLSGPATIYSGSVHFPLGCLPSCRKSGNLADRVINLTD